MFSDFVTYNNHLETQHDQETKIAVKTVTLDGKPLNCANCGFNWLESHKKQVLYKIDESQYCVDCKREDIAVLKVLKTYKSYFEKIEKLYQILHQELWVPVQQDYFDCC